ncbi:pilus assembly PilX family protein [Cognatilysobacter terrigena]|uniref:pilus assembly PilX family protein n=1 Tax=Cognatilysobacter terrigena TaxID=2488749 RepID=UPI0010615E6D|nr:PilX N-terminal domain-containing pilus assembly protein [Lysobacter terrigena]
MRKTPSIAGRRQQRGAVLYVALIMLVIIALLGISGMQVATMQEKMSSNYVNTNIAFQNAEQVARGAECYLDARVNRTSTACAPASTQIEEICQSSFDATSWAKGMAMNTPATNSISMRSIGKCISGQSSLAMGREAEKGGDPNPVFEITAYATDDTTNPTADSAVDTIFMP